VLFTALLASLSACDKSRTEHKAAEASVTDANEAADSAGSDEATAIDAGHGEEVKIAATNFQTSIVSSPAWPESGTGSRRIGYLRHGAQVVAYSRTIKNRDCKDGWYELASGGYACSKAATTDLTSPRVRLAPKQPDRDAGMPYRYGVNLVDGTPLYRRALGADDRKKYEPEASPAKTTDESTDSDDSAMDAGADAGKPTLKSLRGRGVLVRKLARGFYLALDRDFRSANARWWRTTFGLAVPFEPIMLQPGATKYVGSWFEAMPENHDEDTASESRDTGAVDASSSIDGGVRTPAESVAFILNGYSQKFVLSDDGKKVRSSGALPKRSAVLLTGSSATLGGITYEHTSADFWVRTSDLTFAKPQIPADVAPDEKWVDIDLTRQALVAFEGRRPVFATLVSSGRRNPTDKEHDFPTPTGTFRIREKHITTTMDGDVASDGPYSIEDVPWVMYFQGSYALHGAFWHDAFGRQKSHGCVNLSPEDARTLFNWVNPPLPENWHGVFSRDDKEGSRVVVHEDPPVAKSARRASAQ